jgi:glycosyltransferase involved in cell wall biosynthesis
MACTGEHCLAGGLRQRGRKKKDLPGQPLVSIVTIVLNGEEDLRKTMESVLHQSYAPIEYIVIDGGSTDKTISLIRHYEEEIDYWVSEPDNGISDAFNKGVLAAAGKFIGLINAGDWYEPDTIQRVVEAFLAKPETGVVCGALQFWDGLNREYICQSVPRLLARDMTITHPTCFVRADLYRRFGLYEEKYKFAMDYKLLLRLKVQGVRFAALESVLANMQHAGVSEVHWKKALQETHRARVELLAGSFFASRGYYFLVETKRRIRIFLEKMGGSHLITFYRSRLALVRKIKSACL